MDASDTAWELSCTGKKTTIYQIDARGHHWASPNYPRSPAFPISRQPGDDPPSVQRNGELSPDSPTTCPYPFDPNMPWLPFIPQDIKPGYERTSAYGILLVEFPPDEFFIRSDNPPLWRFSDLYLKTILAARSKLTFAIQRTDARRKRTRWEAVQSPSATITFDYNARFPSLDSARAYVRLLGHELRFRLGYCYWASSMLPEESAEIAVKSFPRSSFFPNYPIPHWDDKIGCHLDARWIADRAELLYWLEVFDLFRVPFCFDLDDPALEPWAPQLYNRRQYYDETREGYAARRNQSKRDRRAIRDERGDPPARPQAPKTYWERNSRGVPEPVSDAVGRRHEDRGLKTKVLGDPRDGKWELVNEDEYSHSDDSLEAYDPPRKSSGNVVRSSTVSPPGTSDRVPQPPLPSSSASASASSSQPSVPRRTRFGPPLTAGPSRVNPVVLAPPAQTPTPQTKERALPGTASTSPPALPAPSQAFLTARLQVES